MKVRFKGHKSRYDDLTPGNVYHVIGIEADHYRLMNDFGRPYLYPPRLFRVVDRTRPADWRTIVGEDGERYSYPPELDKPGFFENYFDDRAREVSTLHRYLDRLAWQAAQAPKKQRLAS
jgi:hypothetical protein